jgi:hypothetical protein
MNYRFEKRNDIKIIVDGEAESNDQRRRAGPMEERIVEGIKITLGEGMDASYQWEVPDSPCQVRIEDGELRGGVCPEWEVWFEANKVLLEKMVKGLEKRFEESAESNKWYANQKLMEAKVYLDGKDIDRALDAAYRVVKHLEAIPRYFR